MVAAKLNEEMIEVITRHVRLGLPKKDAAVLAGIDRRTYHEYDLRGHEALDAGRVKDRHALLVLALEKAEADFKMSATALIVQAANQPQHWTAAAWLLERRYPAEYGRRTEITGADGGPIEVRTTSVEELVTQVRLLRPEPPDPLALPSGTNGHSNGYHASPDGPAT